ncbi:MAG TPA: hypothetical protein VN914_16665 [Polyangia bacterium]|nr:hypothetical protein [Polyangia bacterium]
MIRTHRALLAALLMAFLVRLAWISLYPQVPLRGDDRTYVALAQSLAAGQGYLDQGNKDAHYMPGWPLVMAVPFALGLGFTAIRVLLCLLSTAVCLEAYLLGQLLVSRRAGLVAAWFGALFPPLIWYSGVLLAETVSAAVFGLWAVLAVSYAQRGGGWGRVALVGLTTGLLVLFRAEMLPFAPLPFLARALVAGWKPQLPRAALATALCLVVLSPWVVFNLHRFGEPMLLTTAGGIGLWSVSKQPLYTAEETYATYRALKIPGKPKATADRFAAVARENIKRDPGGYLRARLVDLPHFWLGSQTEPVHGAELTISEARQRKAWGVLAWKALGYGAQALYAAGALAGLVLFARRRDRLLPWLIVGAKVAAHAPFIQTTRYGLHVAPLLLCYAGAALLWSYDRLRGAAPDGVTSAPAPAAGSTP